LIYVLYLCEFNPQSMKKIVIISLAVVCIAFLNLSNVSAQSGQKDTVQCKNIPTEVMKIFEKSCINCHSEPGKTMALTHVSFSKWDQYSADKQASKAKAMCNEVTKGKMPPKKFRENNPDGVPTSDELKVICDWAQSLQSISK
jgi:hypothetical protein